MPCFLYMGSFPEDNLPLPVAYTSSGAPPLIADVILGCSLACSQEESSDIGRTFPSPASGWLLCWWHVLPVDLP